MASRILEIVWSGSRVWLSSDTRSAAAASLALESATAGRES